MYIHVFRVMADSKPALVTERRIVPADLKLIRRQRLEAMISQLYLSNPEVYPVLQALHFKIQGGAPRTTSYKELIAQLIGL